jgi:hypothetical protein
MRRPAGLSRRPGTVSAPACTTAPPVWGSRRQDTPGTAIPAGARYARAIPGAFSVRRTPRARRVCWPTPSCRWHMRPRAASLPVICGCTSPAARAARQPGRGYCHCSWYSCTSTGPAYGSTRGWPSPPTPAWCQAAGAGQGRTRCRCWSPPSSRSRGRACARAPGVDPWARALDVERFRVSQPLAGAAVLLLDDTWASGGSAQSAAVALKLAGARAVAAVVLGRHVAAGACPPAQARWADSCAVHAAEGPALRARVNRLDG